MVIEQSTIIGFYIASVAQIMMIALSLFFLHDSRCCRSRSLFLGFSASDINLLFCADFHPRSTVFLKQSRSCHHLLFDSGRIDCPIHGTSHVFHSQICP